ncbi:MAG TPA: bifunctional alpha,alpha-trehalose-phosphate synthase (UDP-forming)/trehalose-phosphatase [Salinimicrobium sp.]|nr:bifunctional alpha,alpha-trehalose-phosphate synthase (UDP-forming)/trehalose-phosphatase [Salinimicrobium sp.]
MNRTMIVSNRLPLKFSIEKNKLEIEKSVGGLATGLESVHGTDSIWIGWTGLVKEKLNDQLAQEVSEKALNENCVPINLTQWQIKNYYFGFSNKTIWPLFHYFMEFTCFEEIEWEVYVEVNQIFCDVVVSNYQEGDTIWVHDYHLLLLPQMVRDQLPEASIGFFSHIPFPSFEIFRTLPWREEILKGILGADLVGFHTYEYERHFLSAVSRILRHPVHLDKVHKDDRIIKIGSFPMGIDYDKFEKTSMAHQLEKAEDVTDLQYELDQHLKTSPEVKLILSIDRLDYTKGIANRIRAFEYFLDKYPQYQEKVRLIMLAVPSRSNVPQYQALKKEVDELVGRINGKYSSVGWSPIWYFYRSMPFNNLIDLYRSCDIAFITPIRDGMNLVAKEYVATRTDQTGVLILSEMAGAAQEMNEALIINPNNFVQIADALKTAIEMPEDEQKVRNAHLQQRLRRYNVKKWANDFMHALNSTKGNNRIYLAKQLSEDILEKMLSEYKNAKKRILFLDYDGTLVNFVDNPKDAKPGTELVQLITQLSSQKNTDVIIISGRDKESLGNWWKETEIDLIAEHGVWKRNRDGKWEKTENVKKDWMSSIFPILETFVDRTPGSFIEQKNYSLAWHYRKADPTLGEIRANELEDVLKNFTVNDSISILKGNHVLEIKNSGIDKGRASSKKLMDQDYDFIFSIGDDWTDEYMFRELPESSFSIKVGYSKTSAKYYVRDTSEVFSILKKFATL